MSSSDSRFCCLTSASSDAPISVVLLCIHGAGAPPIRWLTRSGHRIDTRSHAGQPQLNRDPLCAALPCIGCEIGLAILMEKSEYEERFLRMDQWWETVRAELAAIISESPPRIIYHYTDIDGLLGMILTGKIWATHVSRLNDSSEYHHGIKIVADCVRNSMPASSKPLVEKILSEFKRVETYVASCSTKHDLLSQWRSYSGGEVGYCLGLATDGIATLDDSTPLLEPVIYKDSLAQQVIPKMVNRVDEYLQNNKFGDVEVGFLLGMVAGTLANLACTIKHPKFEEENEYRQFYQPGATSLQLEQNFRNGRFGLTPYVEVPFIEEGRLPLRSVTIGPCQDADLELYIVKTLLEKHSYLNVEVLVSEIPLRVYEST